MKGADEKKGKKRGDRSRGKEESRANERIGKLCEGKGKEVREERERK